MVRKGEEKIEDLEKTKNEDKEDCLKSLAFATSESWTISKMGFSRISIFPVSLEFTKARRFIVIVMLLLIDLDHFLSSLFFFFWLFSYLLIVVLASPSSSSSFSSYNYFYYHQYTLCEFFTPTLAGGYLLETEWQQISSGLPDCS